MCVFKRWGWTELRGSGVTQRYAGPFCPLTQGHGPGGLDVKPSPLNLSQVSCCYVGCCHKERVCEQVCVEGKEAEIINLACGYYSVILYKACVYSRYVHSVLAHVSCIRLRCFLSTKKH